MIVYSKGLFIHFMTQCFIRIYSNQMLNYILLSILVLAAAFADAQDNYRTIGSGNWNAATVWEKDNAGNGVFASTATTPTSSNSISIQIRNGHTISVSSSTAADSIMILSGGILNINNGITLTIDNGPGNDLRLDGSLTNNGTLTIATSAIARVNGTLNNAGTITGAGISSLFFDAGSTYDHRFTTTAGVIPTAAWNMNSTCRISGYSSNGTAPAGLNQIFGNFTWSTPNLSTAAGFFNLSGLPANITGNFTVSSTGAGDALVFTTAGSTTQNIVGNLIVSSGAYYAINAGTGNVTVNCKNLDLSGGSTILDLADASAAGFTNLILSGDFIAPSGQLQYTASVIGAVIFKGTTTQNFTSGLTYATPINFIIDTNAVLDLGTTSFIGGTGTLTARLNSQLRLGSTVSGGAFQSGISQGQIRISGARTFLPGSRVVFNGAGPQFIGNGFPLNAGLEINNSNGVSLTTNTGTAGTLTLTNGNLNLAGQTLTVGNGAGNTGSINVSGGRITGSGTLTRWFGTSAISIGTNQGIFPFTSGSSARFFWVGGTPTTGGTISVSYNEVAGITNYATPFADGSITINRRLNNNWAVSTGNGINLSASIRIQSDSLTGISNVNDLRIALINSPAPGGASTNSGSNATPVINRTGISTIDLNNTFYIASNSSSNALPIDLLTFTATVRNNHVLLNWTAAHPVNFSHFEIMKSDDGENYAKISVIKSKTSITKAEVYEFYDHKISSSQVLYYKLRMVDNDATWEESKVLVVKMDYGINIIIDSPNPVKEKLTIFIKAPIKHDQKNNILILDVTGKEVYQNHVLLNMNQNHFQIDLKSLKSGNYYLLIPSLGIKHKFIKTDN